METFESEIPLSYSTVKVTKSRISKNLLVIPVSLADLLPKNKGTIYLINENGEWEGKRYTPNTSSTRECRIGGLKKFYADYSVQDGDELVIQKIDEGKFRLMPESLFRQRFQLSLSSLENSASDEAVQQSLDDMVKITNASPELILENEFVRLANTSSIQKRAVSKVKQGTRKESVPLYLRKVLQTVYYGQCQLSGFTFLTRNGNPYFEIHHIDSEQGNHLKNLLVVCPNIHAQFTHANVEQTFDQDGWLRTVKFNGVFYTVFQRIDELQRIFEKKVHST